MRLSLKTRVSKVEQQLIPEERLQIRSILRGPDSPEPEYAPGVRVIKVTLTAQEDSGAEGEP